MNPVCSTYGVKLVQKLHEVLLELKDDLLTLKEEVKRRTCQYNDVSTSVLADGMVSVLLGCVYFSS